MKRTIQILCALALDALLGDPRGLPHPAKLTGRLALRLEPVARRLIRDERLAGSVTAGVVIGSAALATAAVRGGARRVHPRAGEAVAVIMLWTTFAARDLAAHALAVYGALERDDLPEARRLVGRMVGRDVTSLSEAGVVRAAVESVAENAVDGVTAPLFYAFLGGPVGAAAYKAVSTLDSTFGYRNKQYARFGWASARVDDGANLLPARLTIVAELLAAALLGHSPAGMLRICLRDGRKYSSPNSGLAEAAMAGALGVQLGGPLAKGGHTLVLPTLGDAHHPLAMSHIKQAVRIMAATTMIWTGLLAGSRATMCAVARAKAQRGQRP
jgi:adenosylcobinamide-phosphate synthase